jgi:Rhodopirellula transposase DDE domain
MMIDVGVIRKKFLSLKAALDERARRLWAATEARSLGRGGVAAVLQATGLSPTTLNHGLREVESGLMPMDRIRRPGGGRKSAQTLDPGLQGALEKLVEPVTRGDPISSLRWTCKSTRNLAGELGRQGYRASHTLVAQLLRDMGYSLQANRKNREGATHPDRNAQFEHINRVVWRQIKRRQPAISVDAKKKELVGDFKNSGRNWRPKGRPEEVRVHDFIDKKLGKAIPYGVYDLARNAGWVSVGITHDTACFAAATIGRWWRRMGRRLYPHARSLLITADSGGSNGNRLRLWKWELQKLADDTGLTIRVCHLPPGTSKWNKIEHRLFSFISQNWRGVPLLTHATIVNLIGSTRTRSGLKVRCELDKRQYAPKIKVTDQQMESIRLAPDKFHGEWNYAIRPRRI